MPYGIFFLQGATMKNSNFRLFYRKVNGEQCFKDYFDTTFKNVKRVGQSFPSSIRWGILELQA